MRRLCYRRLLDLSLLARFVFHGGLALDGFTHRSLYRNRPLVVKAIEQRDYKILGLRRDDKLGNGY